MTASPVLFALAALVAAQTPPPTVRLLGVNEQRLRKVDKDFFGGFEGLSVRFLLQGPAVKEAVRQGNLKVTEAVDDAGKSLIVADSKGGGSFFQTNQPDFADIGKFDRREDRLEREVRMAVPARSAKTVTVRGSIDLIVGGADVNLDFGGVKLREERSLEHAELVAAGIKFKLVKARFGGDRQIACTIDGDERLFRELALVDTAGKATKLDPQGWFQSGNGPKVRNFGASAALPMEGTLRVVVRKGGTTVTVPLVFEKVELP